MRPKKAREILAVLTRVETALLPAVAALSIAYLASYWYIYNPGTSSQQIAYQALGKIGEFTGIWQAYNLFHYAIEISEKALLASAYLMAAVFFAIILGTQRIRAAPVFRLLVSVFMLNASGTAAFPPLVLAHGIAAIAQYTRLDVRGREITLKNRTMLALLNIVPAALLAASVIPGMEVPYHFDVSLSSAAWTHYRNAASIYETGMPTLGTGFFDTRFSIYPPLSHYILALAKAISGLPITMTLQAAYSVFSAIAIVAAYLLAREISGRWYAAIVALYAGLNPHLLGASFFGNYAELVASAMAGICLLYIARYERYGHRKYLAFGALLFAITVSTHWLFAMQLAAFFTFYFAIMRRNRKDLLLFGGIAMIVLLPYMLFMAEKISSKDDISWILHKQPSGQPCDIKCMLLPTFLPFKPVLAQSDLALLVFGGIGLSMARRNRLLQIPAAMLAISFFGFYLLQDYLTFFYPNRLLWLIKFYFAYLIGYGIYLTGSECLTKKMRSGGVVILALIGLLLAANIYDQTSHLGAMMERKQALSAEDRHAMLWIKENTNGEDVVAADALRLEVVYGFTKTRVLQPPQAAAILAEPQKGGADVLAYISSPEDACAFPCTDIIQLRKNASLLSAWKNLSFEKTKERLADSSKIVFEEKSTYIFRLK